LTIAFANQHPEIVFTQDVPDGAGSVVHAAFAGGR
jgi:hypothetical protein